MTHVSPSQQGTYLDCRAGWGWSRLYGKEPTEYSAFGDRGHKVAEDWLTLGIPPDPEEPEGACILAGLDRLPLPGTALVELRIDFISDGVSFADHSPTAPPPPEPWVHYTARIDFLYGYDPARVIVVGDHKTTGNLAYAKSEEVLLEDPQRIDYTAWAGWKYQVPYVVAHWQYYRRPTKSNGPKAETRLVIEDSAKTRERFRHLHETVSLPIVRSAGIHPSKLPKDGIEKGLCDRWYGKPCPYRDECLTNVSAIARAASRLRNIDMTGQTNLLGTLNALAGPQPGAANIPPDVAAMLDNPAVDDATKQSIRDFYKIPAPQAAPQPQFQAPAFPQAAPQPQFQPPAPQPQAFPQAAPQFQPQPQAAPQFQPPAPQPVATPMPMGAPPAPSPRAPKAKTIKMDRSMFLLFQSGVPGRTVEEAMRWAEAVGL